MSSSQYLDRLISALRLMPGIGPVSASRIACYLLERRRAEGIKMAETILESLKNIASCPECRNFKDPEGELCAFCADPARRGQGLLCVVESPLDVQAIENSGSFRGCYFVLHGRLSPLDGTGPEELGFDLLERRLAEGGIKEVILALSQTVEGEAAAQYLAALAGKYRVAVSRIATGVPLGGSLESVDQETLASSFMYRRSL